MTELCPQLECTGIMHRRGKGRSPVCNICGYREPLRRGRPRKDPDRKVTDRDVYLAKKTAADREVTYALFDPSKLPEGAIGYIHRVALAKVVIGSSRQSVERENPGMKAVPIGRLKAREKRWMEESQI